MVNSKVKEFILIQKAKKNIELGIKVKNKDKLIKIKFLL